jgi:hypothetical protein
MKRKILSLLLCFSMAVSILAGCGTKDVDATDEKVSDVKVTKKMEEEYVARIQAYQEYYEQVRTDYNSYVVSGMITLDSEGLPLFWLCLSQDGSEDNCRTQLIGYDNDEVMIMAERSEYIVPYRGSEIILAIGRTDDERDNYYLYDDEKKDFRIINSELDELRNNEIIYSEEELEKTLNYLMPIIESMNFYDSIQIAMNESACQIAYLGKREIDVNYEALSYIDVTSNIHNVDVDTLIGCYLRAEYADNKVAMECFESLPDADLEGISIDGYLNKHSAEMYDDIVKEANEQFITSTGTVISVEAYENSVNILEDKEWKVSKGGSHPNGRAYFAEAELGQLLRGLVNNPIYSEEELYLYVASISFNYEIVDISLESFSLSDASDQYIEDIVEDYIGGRNYYEANFTDELIAERDTLLDAEPYKSINEYGIDNVIYENNVATVEVYDSSEIYQFQVEFTEDGNKISKITYIDLLETEGEDAYNNIENSHAVEVQEQETVTETYHDRMYSCSEFELNNQRLLIDADSFNIDLEISDDCVWQTRYSDGSVYDSSYDELHRIWEESLDSKEKADEMGLEYESPEGLGVEVKDGKVVAVYMTAS